MLKIRILIVILFSLNIHAIAQFRSSQIADSLYKVKNYPEAGSFYLQSINESDFKALKKGSYYNAACCFALAGKTDSAIVLLKKAIDNGYTNLNQINKDTDLSSLHHNLKWNKTLKTINPISFFTNDPRKARFITSDVSNFWKAYDLAQKDTTHRLAIFKKYYVDPGTAGLQDYFATKVRSMNNFIKSQNKKPKFYSAIRKNTYAVDKQKPQMVASFLKFKQIYPEAKFPSITFVIGAFNAGGTVTDAGLLIGFDQFATGPDVPLEELTIWQRNNIGKVSDIPYVIAHELIHFNQERIDTDTTLLKAVLKEGMADFIGELIAGKTANERLKVWVKGKEKKVWTDFRKEMYLNRSKNWIGNGSQETADRPADLGYWVGYEICKAYYANAMDKNKAIQEMLNIKNSKDFYEQSGASKLFSDVN